MTVLHEGGDLVVEARDAGAGGADVDGDDLEDLRDRLWALGGRLEIDCPLATGTTVRATVPTIATEIRWRRVRCGSGDREHAELAVEGRSSNAEEVGGGQLVAITAFQRLQESVSFRG